jgi:hypothetical protein
MTASLAATAAPHLMAPPLGLVFRNGRLFGIVGFAIAAGALLAPGMTQAVLLLAGPAAVLLVVARAGGDDDLNTETRRIVLGLPQPID